MSSNFHHATYNQSTAFCKELIDAYPEPFCGLNQVVVYVEPIHLACSWGASKRGDTADTIQYMLELDPELVNAEGINGYLPIKIAPLSRECKIN